jgi:prepilin-type processing-associated H-X9-DG protein
LAELLICVAVIAILAGILLPAIQMTRESARRKQCQNNLFELGVGLHNYHDMHRTFPPGYVSAVGPAGQDVGPGWGWAALLLPMVGKTVMWQQLRFEDAPGSLGNATVRIAKLELFVCPSDPTPGQSCYVASFGRGDPTANPGQGDGVFFRNSRIRLRDIEDGAMTFLLGERSSALGKTYWMDVVDAAPVGPSQSAPSGITEPSRVLGHTGPVSRTSVVHSPNGSFGCPADFGSHHSGGSYFLFLDGSVRLVSDQINASVYAALATRAGREAVTATDF